MRRGILLVLLLLSPTMQAQGEPPLEVSLDATRFHYGPEDWKGGDPSAVEDQASFSQQSADWSSSLGLRLEANLTVTARSGAAQTGWEYVATVSDGATTVAGVVRSAADGVVSVWFDVDGQRALPGGAPVPALLSGTWTVRVEAYAVEGTAREPRGWGQDQVETDALSFGGVRARFNGPLLPGLAIPEHLLPRIREVGPGPNTWMNAAPIGASAFVADVHGAPMQEVQWVAYEAIDPAPPVADPGAGTPLEDLLPSPSPTLMWQRFEYGTVAADAGGRIRVQLPLNATTGMYVVAAHGLQGGLVTFALAASPETPRIDAWEAPEPGQEGDVEVGVGLEGNGAQQLVPGQAYALQQQVPATTGQALGGRTLSQGPLVVDATDHWRAVYDARPIRSAGIPNYTFLAFFFDDQGAYRTHVAMLRGGDLDLEVPRLGVAHEAEVGVGLRNLADDGRTGLEPALALPARIALSFDGGEVGNVSVRVPETGRLERIFLLTPQEDGSKAVSAIVDTGDTRAVVQEVHTVLRQGDFEDRPWYDPEELVPAPMPWFLVGVLAMALLQRRRRPPDPSQP